MNCHPVTENDKVTGWACSIGRQASVPCYICGKASIRLCDYDVGSGTCDRAMCRKHSNHVDKDTDYCTAHYNELTSRQMKL